MSELEIVDDDIKHGARKHHPYSPSKLNNLEACPQFRQLDSANEASLRGTAQHEAFEKNDDTGLSDDEVEAVNKCRVFVADVEAMFRKPARLQEVSLSVDERNEKVIDAETGEVLPTSQGFLDLFIYESDPESPLYGYGVLIDFKFGKNAVVEAENNLQAFAYFLGVIRELPFIKRAKVQFLLPYRDEVNQCEIVRTESEHIFQLIWVDERGEPQSRAENLLLRIQTVVERAVDPNSKANPNSFTCMFCSKKATCSALHSLALRVADKYAPLQVPAIIDPSLVPMATPEDVSKGMQFFSTMEGLAKGYKAEATKRALLEDNFDVPGYRVVSTERREVVDNAKFIETAKRVGNLTDSEVLECSEISLTKIEKKVNDKAPRGSKKAAVEAFASELESAGATQKGSPVVYLRVK